jgi:hypothetical protein
MKKFLILLLWLVGSYCYSQNVDSLKTELLKVYKIKIVKQDSVIGTLDDQVASLNSVILKQDMILLSDSVTFKLYEGQIDLYERNIKLYDEHLKKTKPKFWESRPFNFIMGATTILLGSWVTKNVIN